MSDIVSSLKRSLANIARREIARLGIVVTTEYRVVRQIGIHVELQIVKKATGLPDTPRVVARPSAPGYSCVYTPGSLVLLAFERGDPTLPFIAFGGRVGDPGTLPKVATIDVAGTGSKVTIGAGAESLELAGAVDPPVRFGDAVAIDPITGVITFGPVQPTPGHTVVSKVKV